MKLVVMLADAESEGVSLKSGCAYALKTARAVDLITARKARTLSDEGEVIVTPLVTVKPKRSKPEPTEATQ